jgi:imidazolonepropionase-like amidohydrolase
MVANQTGEKVPVGDSRIHDLALEASWAAKYAGLSELEAIRLVTKNVEEILGLEASKDIVVWENSPLQWGGSVVLSFEQTEEGVVEVATCWPDEAREDSA